jgi:anti-sigma regulatory factor (Ser/Thr protein kinase)
VVRAGVAAARLVEVDVVDGDGGQSIMRRPITVDGLASLRGDAIALARTAGLSDDRAALFALAVNEAAANTIVHAGGTGEVTLGWDGHSMIFARITDRGLGTAAAPRARLPDPGAAGGRGLWLSRQVTDGIRVEGGPDGTVVHLEMTVAPSVPNPGPPGDAA